MLGSFPIMAFVAATDAVRAKTFYRDALGLRFVSEDQFAVVFDAGGVMLRVTLLKELSPARHTVLGWQVPDIVQAARDLASRGVELLRYPGMQQDELGIWSAPGGARVAWFHDPDGNVLSISQL